MQVTETLNEGLKREFECVIAADTIDDKVEAKLKELAPTVNLPGFRPGKAPLKILRQRFGRAVTGEILDETMREGIQSTLEERDIRPATQPQVDMIEEYQDGGDLKFSIKAEILPEIEPVDFSTIC